LLHFRSICSVIHDRQRSLLVMLLFPSRNSTTCMHSRVQDRAVISSADGNPSLVPRHSSSSILMSVLANHRSSVLNEMISNVKYYLNMSVASVNIKESSSRTGGNMTRDRF
jgi:hypothetical protein